MSVTVTNLLQGPAQMLVSPFGTTEPANADVAPAVGWVDVGGTDGGARLVVGQTYSKMSVDQIALEVGARLVGQVITVATSMAEATLENLKTAFNQPAGAGTTFELTSQIGNAEPNYKAVMLVGQKPGGGNRLIIIRRALSTENVELAWKKDDKTMIPVTFSGFYVSSSIGAIKIDETPGP